MAASTATTPFGTHLRHWRRVRGLSQLDLAHRAEVSSRHISFMETGRSRPSSTMVLRLAETLDVPLRQRNELLRAAGFAAAFETRPLDAAAMAPVRRIVDTMLAQHEPFPAFVIDRWWDVVAVNDAAARLFPPAAGDGPPPNAIETFLAPGPFREMVENWAEVAWITVHRLRRELAAVGHDERLARLSARADAWLDGVPPPPPDTDLDAPVVASHLRIGGCRVSTISCITSFSGAREVTTDELRIEMVFPADEAAESFFRAMAGA